MANDNNTSVTVYGRLSFPVWTMAEALGRNAAAPANVQKKDDQVAPEFNLLLEQGQLDKYMDFVKAKFLPYCVQQSAAGEKRNALTQKEADAILRVLDSDWEMQPPYISLKPVSEKSLALAPASAAMLKIVGGRGRDMELRAIVRDESELAVPDPDIIKFPVVKPLHQTIHQMYPGAYVAATVNLYSFISGKTPGFSSSATVAVFREDADRFGGGVELNEDELFED